MELWNYRIFEVDSKFLIRKVFYNEDGTHERYDEDYGAITNNFDKLQKDFHDRLLAFYKPVLKEETFFG